MKNFIIKHKFLLIIVMSMFFLLFFTGKSNAASENYFFIGDSRTYHMITNYTSARGNFAGKIVNQSSIGYDYVGTWYYDWFDSNKMKSKLNALSSAPKGTKVIIWLGVNDMNNTNYGSPTDKAELYVQQIKNLANTYKDLVFCQVSVTAVYEPQAKDKYSDLLNNSRIDEFNNALKNKISSANLSNYKYIDVNSELKSTITNDNPTVGDGLHYTGSFYRTISDKIYEKVSKLNSDTTAPTLKSISVTSPLSGKYKAGQTIKIVATYSENVYGTKSGGAITSSTAPKLTIRFGSALIVNSSSPIRTATFSSVSNTKITYTYKIQSGDNGTLYVNSHSGTVFDKAGNKLSVGKKDITGNTITADTTAPKCTIKASTADTTNASSITYTFTWSETLANNTFTASDITVTNGTKGTFKATTANKVYTLVVTNNGSGTQKVEVAAGKCTDAVGNKNTAASKSITIDRATPKCTITANAGNITNLSSITYTFTWSETLANNTFTASDITVTNGTKGAFKTVRANKVYTLVVNNSGSCTQKVEVAAGKCTDTLGNKNTAASKSITIDRTAPTCTITANTENSTNSSNITYTFTWSETLADNSFTIGDITVTNGTKGTFKATTTNKVYTLVVTKNGSGMQKVEVAAGKCLDLAGNKNVAASKTVTIDGTAPTCKITANVNDTTNASSITYTFAWSEILANNTFTVDDITVTNGTKGTFRTLTANKVYSLEVVNNGSCTQKVEVVAGKCTDEVGNKNATANKTIVVDRTAPICTITASSGNPTNAKSITYTFTWSETLADNSFTASDITVTNGTKETFKTVTLNKVYTLVVTNNENCTQKVEVAAGKCTDLVGNKNGESSKSITINRQAPTLEVEGNPTNWVEEATLVIKAIGHEADLESVTVNGDNITMTNGEGTYKINENGTYEIVAIDKQGNQNTKTEKVSKIDTTVPILEVTGNSTDLTKEVILTIKASDTESGLKDVTVNGESIKITKGEGKFTVDANGTYTIVATDNVGRETKEEITVDKIYKAGDLNGSGKPDTNDLLKIMQYIVVQRTGENKENWTLSEEKQTIADVNQDGKIDQRDVLKIKRYLAASRSEEIARSHPDWLEL